MTTKYYSFTALIICIAFFACKKSSSSPSPHIYATINGKPFNGTNCIAKYIRPGFNLDIYGGSFQDTNVTYPNIHLVAYNYFDLGPNYYGLTYYGDAYLDSGATGVPAVHGGIAFTNQSLSSAYITGTFSFTATDSSTAINGSFVAKNL